MSIKRIRNERCRTITYSLKVNKRPYNNKKQTVSSATDQVSKCSQCHFRTNLLSHGDKGNTKNSYTLRVKHKSQPVFFFSFIIQNFTSINNKADKGKVISGNNLVLTWWEPMSAAVSFLSLSFLSFLSLSSSFSFSLAS